MRIVHPNETERLTRKVEMQRSLGVSVNLISRQELLELEPDWTVDDVQLAAYEPDSGHGDGAVVASDFLARARDLGVCYLPRTEATAFQVEGDRIRGVETTLGAIHAAKIIAATDPWTRPVFHKIGYDLPLETEYHQVAILRNSSDIKGHGCACIDSGSQCVESPGSTT